MTGLALSPRRLLPGHLCARRVLHLQSPITAGGSGRGELPEQEAQYAHRDPAQENADQVEGNVRQVRKQKSTLG